MIELTEQADIFIELKRMLRSKPSGSIVLTYAECDAELNLTAGSTKINIVEAAESLEIETTTVGGSRIELKKPFPQTQFRIERG